MSISSYNIMLILCMALVTYLPRALPLVLLSSRRLNPTIERWLSLIPPAVLAALLAPELLLHKDSSGAVSLFISPYNIMLMAAIPSFIVAWRTKSFFGTVIVGMGSVALGRYLFTYL